MGYLSKVRRRIDGSPLPGSWPQMEYEAPTLAGHLRSDGRPKRILALDGGGLRGVLSLGILARVEDLLRGHHGGGEDFRLCHYFDLIAGTSTGAIIAAALAQGWSVEELREKYFSLGERVFEKSLFRRGFLRAKYDERRLTGEFQDLFGTNTTLGSDRLLTGLLIVTKRLDTGSPWPVGNNPRGQYFNAGSNGRLGNGDYRLWQVVRASTAAPSYFEPEAISISGPGGGTPVVGSFVDGGVSPYNNPALQALMYATLEGYRIGWSTGADRLLLVSVGTGSTDPVIRKSTLAAGHAVSSLLSVMRDSAMLQETMLQWMSASATARSIDRELEDLRNDVLGGTPLLRYLRYDVDLGPDNIRALDPALTNADAMASLSEMDAPENMDVLHRLGMLAGRRDVSDSHFDPIFNLPPLTRTDPNDRTPALPP
jgi:predicted acylesterase/phospholipase RssA